MGLVDSGYPGCSAYPNTASEQLWRDWRSETTDPLKAHLNFQRSSLLIWCWLWCLSGPLNRLNAILSLLHPLDRYRIRSARIGSAIGRPYLALSRVQKQVGVLNRLVLNRLGGSTAR